jgi:hypothetical protein
VNCEYVWPIATVPSIAGIVHVVAACVYCHSLQQPANPPPCFSGQRPQPTPILKIIKKAPGSRGPGSPEGGGARLLFVILKADSVLFTSAKRDRLKLSRTQFSVGLRTARIGSRLFLQAAVTSFHPDLGLSDLALQYC